MSWRVGHGHYYEMQKVGDLCFVDGEAVAQSEYDALLQRTTIADDYDPTGYYDRQEKHRLEIWPWIAGLALVCFLGFIGYSLLIAFGPRM